MSTSQEEPKEVNVGEDVNDEDPASRRTTSRRITDVENQLYSMEAEMKKQMKKQNDELKTMSEQMEALTKAMSTITQALGVKKQDNANEETHQGDVENNEETRQGDVENNEETRQGDVENNEMTRQEGVENNAMTRQEDVENIETTRQAGVWIKVNSLTDLEKFEAFQKDEEKNVISNMCVDRDLENVAELANEYSIWPKNMNEAPNVRMDAKEINDLMNLKTAEKTIPLTKLKGDLTNYLSWETSLFRWWKMYGWTNLDIRNAMLGTVKPSVLMQAALLRYIEGSIADEEGHIAGGIMASNKNSGTKTIWGIRRQYMGQYSNMKNAKIDQLSNTKFLGGNFSEFCNQYRTVFYECVELQEIYWCKGECQRFRQALMAHPNSFSFMPGILEKWEQKFPDSINEAISTATTKFINIYPSGSADTERIAASVENGTVKDCGYCGRDHKRRKCPAYGQQCTNCDKMNHFASKCRNKTEKDVTAIAMEEKADPFKHLADTAEKGGITIV